MQNKRQIISQRLALPDACALREAMDSGKITATEVVKDYLDRLTIFHPQLNAATEILKESALEAAKNPISGPLSGLPISVKETFGIQGKTITTGSKRGTHIYAEKDAVIVQKLKDAGAILIARTNVPEFAMMPETDNLIFGQTRNPLNLDRTAGGSSGGEGALVSSGGSVMGVGSDIGGSIRMPAAFCGIVGFKPASDAVDKTGTWPEKQGYSDTMLALGPLTRSVRDAKLLYNVIAEKPLTQSVDSLSGLRLFYPQVYRKSLKNTEISSAVGGAQAVLTQAGMSKAHIDFSDASQLALDFNSLIIYDFEQAMHESLMGMPNKRISLLQESLAQLTGKPTISSWLYQMLVGMQVLRPSKSKAEDIIARFEQARKKYYEILGDDGIIVLPTIGILAPPHGKMIAELRTPGVVEPMKPTVFCNVLNLPAISLPVWKYRDLATGLVPSVMLACKPGAEHNLFAAAAHLEQHLM